MHHQVLCLLPQHQSATYTTPLEWLTTQARASKEAGAPPVSLLHPNAPHPPWHEGRA